MGSTRTEGRLKNLLRVDDAGPDGDSDTIADNTVFAVEGIFVL